MHGDVVIVAEVVYAEARTVDSGLFFCWIIVMPLPPFAATSTVLWLISTLRELNGDLPVPKPARLLRSIANHMVIPDCARVALLNGKAPRIVADDQIAIISDVGAVSVAGSAKSVIVVHIVVPAYQTIYRAELRASTDPIRIKMQSIVERQLVFALNKDPTTGAPGASAAFPMP